MADYVSYPCIHPAPVLRLVGTDDLDLDAALACPLGDFPPGGSRYLDWVHGIGYYGAPQSEVVLGYRIGDHIPLRPRYFYIGVAERLLYGIDAQMNGTNAPCQPSGNCCLAHRGEAPEDQ